MKSRIRRREFNSIKDKVIEEWEKQTGQKWPTYTEDIISSKTGEPIRRKGDKFDAHHIIENSFGGEHDGGIYILLNFQMNTNQVFMGKDYLQIKYLEEVNKI